MKTKLIKGEKAKRVQEILRKCDKLERGESMEFLGMLFTRL